MKLNSDKNFRDKSSHSAIRKNADFAGKIGFASEAKEFRRSQIGSRFLISR